MSERIIGRIAGLSIILLIFGSACASRESAMGGPKTSGGRSFDDVLKQGGLFLSQRNYDKAVEEFSQAIQLNPESAKAHNLRGLAYFQRKDYGRAEKDFIKAAELIPSYSEAYNNLGGIYFLKKQYEKSKAMFQKCLSLAPDSVSSLYSLGTLLITQGEMEEGRRLLSRGMDLAPEFLLSQQVFFADISSTGITSADVYITYAGLFASKGNAEKTLEFLIKAEQSGFKEWSKVFNQSGFDKVRDDPAVKEFLRRKS